MQSLVPKLDEICVFTSVCHPDLLVFSETWLSENVDNPSLSIPGYSNPIRKDRLNKRGGGVCVYHKANILVKEILCCVNPPFFECVWIALPNSKLVILVLYCPPNLSSSQLNDLILYIDSEAENALNMFSDSKFIIMGDLNHLPTEDLESTFGLEQIVNQPTRKNAILDKILMDHRLCDCFHSPIVGPNFGKADHLSVYLKPQKKLSHKVDIRKVFDYRESNVLAFIQRLQEFPWTRLYSKDLTIDEKCDAFYDAIDDAFTVIPHNYVEMSSRDKPWMTPILKHMINCRYDAFRNRDFGKYNHLKEKIKSEIEKAKSIWVSSLKRSHSGVWKAVQSVTGKEINKEGIKLCDSVTSGKGVAEQLSEKFASVFTQATITSDTILNDNPTEDEKWKVEVSVAATSKLLSRLKPFKSAGSDNLNPRLLKASHDVLAAPLTHLFAESILTCTVPVKWKTANVSPIPKCANPSISEFRPVSLLPIPSKVLETIVLDSVKSRLVDLYGDNQFGFRPGSSTLNAHVAIHDFITRIMDSPQCDGIAMIALDLSKAFDRLSHISLLQTLSRAKFPKPFVKWIQSFLTQRTQKVIFQGNSSSKEVTVTSGVPQGSILAPFLFAAHVGSLKAVHSQTVLIKYADDFTFLIPCERSKEALFLSHVNSEISHIKSWCQEHNLKINDDKTKSVYFGKTNPLSDTQLCLPGEVDELKVLGITYHKSLKWDMHVKNVVRTAGRRVHVLRYLHKIHSVTKKDLVMVYNGYVLSTLEFCSAFFVGLNKKNDDKMERIRRRCHRIICGQHCKCDYFPPLRKKREDQAMKIFCQMLRPGHISNSLLPHFLPRTGQLFQEYIKTNRRANSFIPFCVRRWNSARNTEKDNI